MKPPNKKSAAKSTDANIASASKNTTTVPPIGFMASDEDFDLSLNDDLDLDDLDTLDDDEDDY